MTPVEDEFSHDHARIVLDKVNCAVLPESGAHVPLIMSEHLNIFLF